MIALLLGAALAADLDLTEVPAGSQITLPSEEVLEVPEASFLFSLERSSPLDGRLHLLPPGSVILMDGAVYGNGQKMWLMPDSYYREALVQSRQLEICEPALEKMTVAATNWQERTYGALAQCSEQFGRDEKLVDDLQAKLFDMEVRALTSESQLKQARRNMYVSWAIAGTLVLGAGYGLVQTLGNN